MVNLSRSLSDEEIARGFDPSTDIFKRKDLADRLTSLLNNLEGGSVCLLDGRWGTGKSTFVRQWAAEVRNTGGSTIYFDAFASDYVDTPFTALAGLFIRAAHDAKRSSDPAVQKFLDKAAKIGRALAATSAKVGLKAATLGIMDGSEVDGLSDAIADGLGEIAESSVKNLLKEHSDREAQFEAMRGALKDLAAVLSNRAPDGGGTKPLIVFIDELDRCRPDFSLGILEILKHFFRVDGIHFVLVSSKEYLELAVDGRYGAGVAASEYLEKFYDFVVLFESNYERHGEGNVGIFASKILDKFISDKIQDSRDFKSTVRELCVAYRLTLRQIENACINASLAFLSVENLRIYKPGFLIAFTSLMKAVDLNLYRKLRNNTLTWPEVQEFLARANWNAGYGERLGKVLRWHLDPNIQESADEWVGFSGDTWRYNLERLNTLQYIAISVVDRFASPDAKAEDVNG